MGCATLSSMNTVIKNANEVIHHFFPAIYSIIIVLSNRSSSPLYDIADEIAEMYLGK